MDIIVYIGLLIAGSVLGFAAKLAPGQVIRIAKVYIVLALATSLSLWLFYFAGIKSVLMQNVLSFITKWGSMAGHLLLGYLIIAARKTLNTGELPGNNIKTPAVINLTLWAVSIITANTFIIATVGKAENMSNMEAFFKQSGYAIWFLYFIMSAEPLGALGILLHFKLKTGPMATAGIQLIMLGAVYTHWHNNDPFSDSYAAVSQLITLSLLQVLYYFERQAGYIRAFAPYVPVPKIDSAEQ